MTFDRALLRELTKKLGTGGALREIRRVFFKMAREGQPVEFRILPPPYRKPADDK